MEGVAAVTRYQEARNTMPIRLYPHQQRLLDILCNHNSHVRLWYAYKRYKHLFDQYPHMLAMFYENGEDKPIRGKSARIIAVDDYGG